MLSCGIAGFRTGFTFRDFNGEAFHFLDSILTEATTPLEVAQHFESTVIPVAGLAHILRTSTFLRKPGIDGTELFVVGC